MKTSLKPFLSSIAAVSLDGIIGVEGRLPWDLPEDLKYFREKTKGKKVIMGRKTYDSIGRPLPNRENFVVTRDSEATFPEGVRKVADLGAWLREYAEISARTGEEIFVIGGEEIYRLTLPWVNRLYLTVVDVEIGRKAAARFPSSEKILKGGVVPSEDYVSIGETLGLGLPSPIAFAETKREERQQPLFPSQNSDFVSQVSTYRFLEFSRTETF